jgi:glycosyltransferase involved in cell wall biosynthesis
VQFVLSGLWGAEKAAALADADCLCLPSWSENFGNAAAEAAAFGLPVVVSRAAGVAEWLPAGVRHEVDPGDIESIRSALEVALTSSARRMALSAGPTVRSRLDWTTLAVCQREWYSSLLR